MSRVPPTNGGTAIAVPPDLKWDENDPPQVYPCSMYTQHDVNCQFDKQEPSSIVPSETAVKLINESFAFRRAGMSFSGVPNAYAAHIPIPGIQVELVDLLCWTMTVREILVETFNVDEEELEEKFRIVKLNFLQGVRLANEEQVRKARTAQQIAIAQKSPLLGPDGRPLI